jgi:hypothetical protein
MKKLLAYLAVAIILFLCVFVYAVVRGTAVIWITAPSRISYNEIRYKSGVSRPSIIGNKYMAIVPIRGDQSLVVSTKLDNQLIQNNLGYVTTTQLSLFNVKISESGDFDSHVTSIP